MVHNFFGCGLCVVQKFQDALRAVSELTGLSDEWHAKYIVMYDESQHMRNMREAITQPKFDADNCAVCYHPFGEASYRKLEVFDGEGNTIHAHAVLHYILR
jgi:hypothetical protein